MTNHQNGYKTIQRINATIHTYQNFASDCVVVVIFNYHQSGSAIIFNQNMTIFL